MSAALAAFFLKRNEHELPDCSIMEVGPHEWTWTERPFLAGLLLVLSLPTSDNRKHGGEAHQELISAPRW
jgi:hypothetical protein